MSEHNRKDDELVGQTIAGRYRIISRLEAGGMGVAYRAWDERGGVPVVIKIPKKAFLDDPKFAERFAREIRLLQGLRHSHIVPIVDVGEHEGLPYVAMRFLPGGSLANRRLRDEDGKTRPNPAGMLHLWLPAIADALDYVHANGVVHRDVKPANIFFDAFWGAFLGDFGIAKIVEESESFDRENTLTATNLGIGTLEYMGPEQFAPKPALDGRIDQYALAVTVYEMLAGTRPFTGTTAHLIVEVTTMPAPRLDRAVRGLPASLVDAVHRGLAKNPGDRFSTCGEFAYHTLRDVPLLADEPDIARLLCPKCSNILKLPVSAAGQKGKCPRCQTQMKVAADLGALWLLDEARRQRRAAASAVDAKDIKDDKEPAETGVEETHPDIDEEALEAFKPVSSTTPIEKEARKQAKKASTGMILGGVAAAAVVLAGLWMVFGGGGTPRPLPEPTEEQKLAQAEKILRQNPNDTAANDVLGRHWCFKKDDWKKGLPYLAKSDAIGLWSTAKKELELAAANPAAGAGDMVRLAKSWWTLSGQKGIITTADEAKAIEKHAAGIYIAVVDGLTDAKVIDDTNRWLDRNPEFLAMAGGKRPQQQNTTRVIYLSKLQETSSKVIHFGFGKGTINGLQNPIRSIIDGQPSPHGLSMHPGDGPDGACFVKYTLPEGVERFTAIATLDQGGSFDHCGIGFEVIADGRSVWKSNPINKDHKSETCDIGIPGCKELELRTFTVTAAFGGHAIWVEPRVSIDRETAEPEQASVWVADLPIASRKSHFFHHRISWQPIGGKGYENTTHIHPEVGSGKSQLVYQIDGKCDELAGAIGILDSAERVASPQVFRIVGDGKELWKSAPFKQTGKGEDFRVNVSGVKALELLTDCTGSKFDAHCVWIEPRLKIAAGADF